MALSTEKSVFNTQSSNNKQQINKIDTISSSSLIIQIRISPKTINDGIFTGDLMGWEDGTSITIPIY